MPAFGEFQERTLNYWKSYIADEMALSYRSELPVVSRIKIVFFFFHLYNNTII